MNCVFIFAFFPDRETYFVRALTFFAQMSGPGSAVCSAAAAAAAPPVPSSVTREWCASDLKNYFKKSCPVEDVWNLFNCKLDREWATEISGDVMVRGKHCKTPSELQKLLVGTDVKHATTSAHVGWAGKADAEAEEDDSRQRKGAKFGCELRFDIDLTDYDDLRALSCKCKEKQVCQRCFGLAKCGVYLLKKILQSRFGYSQFMPVFSGRRGMHLFVLDKETRALSPAARHALVLNVGCVFNSKFAAQHGSMNWYLPKRDNLLASEMNQTVETPNDAPSQSAAASVAHEKGNSTVGKEVRTLFNQFVVGGLQLFKSDSVFAKALEPFTSEIQIEARRLGGSANETRWKALYVAVESRYRLSQAAWRKDHMALYRLMASCVWPRCDAAVTTQPGHLIKLPFSVNPHTGLICIALPGNALADFSIGQCPHISDVSLYLSDTKKHKDPLKEAVTQLREFAKGVKFDV